MARNKHVINVEESVHFPKGFTISDNRIEDCLQKFLTPSEYCIWRQYLRYWGSNKKVAYPSLSRLSEATGMSEKTIRKSNKSLVIKGFIKYRRGCSNRSNRYYYVSIERLINKYCKDEDIKVYEYDSRKDPILDYAEDEDRAFEKQYNKLTELEKYFYTFWKESYLFKMGINYFPSKKDMEAIKSLKVDNEIEIDRLINIFFNSKNKYIQKSDMSIYFFSRPKTMQIIISEFNDTDRGRWLAQANKYYDKVKHLKDGPNIDKEIDNILGTKLGSNSTRKSFIKSIIIDKIKSNR